MADEWTEAEARDEAFRAHMRSCRRLLAEAKRVRYSPAKHAETLALAGELRRFAARTHAEPEPPKRMAWRAAGMRATIEGTLAVLGLVLAANVILWSPLWIP